MPIKVNCEVCGKEFVKNPSWANRSKHNYCSKKCMGIALHKSELWVDHPCQYCGEMIKAKGGHWRRYCSLQCAGANRQEKGALWRNSEYIKAYMRDYGSWYRQTERGRATVNTSNHNRRASLRGSEGQHTAEEWLTLKSAYRNRCGYCGRKSRNLSKDHIIPLSMGGTNDIGNIVPACGWCNRSKGIKSLLNWSRFKGLQLSSNL